MTAKPIFDDFLFFKMTVDALWAPVVEASIDNFLSKGTKIVVGQSILHE